MDRSLTPRQRETLAVISRAVAAGEAEPTLAAIGAALGGIAPPTVFKHIQALEEKGYLRRHPNRRPPIELVIPLPVAEVGAASWTASVVGDLAAGEPLGIYGVPTATIGISGALLPADPSVVALRVRGYRLVGEGLLDGDLLIVRPGDAAPPGATVVALVGGAGATVRRYRPVSGGVRLESAQPQGEPLLTGEVTIYGRVLLAIRRCDGEGALP